MTPGSRLESARLGLYFGWGAHTLYERGENVLTIEGLDPASYRDRARDFGPRRYDARAWAELAREAGARYALLSARSSDGYCLFPSARSTFCSSRDLVGEFLEAFRRVGPLVGVSYSLSESTCSAFESGPSKDPDGFAQMVDRAHAQLLGLCSTCGLLDIVRIESLGPYPPELWRCEELVRMVRRLQPTAAIIAPPPTPDSLALRCVSTATQHTALEQRELAVPVVQQHWGYHSGDQKHKSSREIVALLAGCAARGERLLLGVGPRADGALPLRSVDLLRDVGQWLRANAAAMVGVRPGITAGANLGHTTVSDGTLYLTVLYWPGSSLHLARVSARVLSVRFLVDDWAIDWRQEGDHLWLRNLPTLPPDARGTVIAIETDRLIV